MKNKGITVSAPGKLMLLGEHAVVYQRPCLVSAVSWRLKLKLEKIKKRISQIETGDKKGFVKTAVENFSQIWGLDFGVKIKKENALVFNYGLGSSAAATVAALKGLAKLAKINLSKNELFDLAYQTILDVQGVGSGFDVAAAIYGGTIYYKTGGAIIKSLTNKPLPLIVGYSGVKADTPTIVRQLAKKRKKQPQVINKIFDQITHLVKQGKKAILKKNWPTLGNLMNKNQKLLLKLGVSTPKLEKLITAAKKAGALGSKLSGAGGGDCMIALVDKNHQQAVKKAIEKAGGKIVNIKVGAKDGVKLEKNSSPDSPNELFVVVDKNDQIIGYKTRRQCHQNKSLIHRAIGVIIFNQKGQILLQKRSLKKDVNPGLYTLSCSGHVSKGEEYQKSAQRELHEEVGLKLPLKLSKKFLHQSKRESEMETLYLAKSEGPFFPNQDEIDYVKFFSQKEIKHLSRQNKLTSFAKTSLQKIGIL